MNKSVYQYLLPVWDLSFIFWFTVAFMYGNSRLVTLSLVVFLGISVAVVLLKGKFKISSIPVLYAIFIFVCFLNLKLGYSIRPSMSSATISTLLKGLLFMLASYYYASMRGANKFAYIFAKSTLVATVVMYTLNLVLTGSIVIRGQGAFNANALAVASAFSICYVIFKGKAKSAVGVLEIAWLSLFCLAAGTRKAFVAIAVILVVYILLKAPKKILLNLLYAAIIIGVGYFCLTKIPFIYNSIGYRFESLFKMLGGGTGDGSAESRQAYIDLALKYYKRRPIFGYGVNTFRTLEGAHGNYSHNNYVELLFSTGIVGTVTFYLIHLWVLISGISQYIKHRSQNALLSIAFVIATLVSDIAWVSYHERTLMIFVLLCYVLSRKEASDDEKTVTNTRKSI